MACSASLHKESSRML